ncbi:MAG: alpha-N-acetylglucosaminidase [Bacteroidota bacterium]
MNFRLFACTVLLLAIMQSCSSRKEALPVEELVERISPQFSGDILFEQMNSPSGKDLFELESLDNGKIMIRGNNQNSMAVGLGHYLKYYCNTSVSWFADQAVELPEVLPAVPEKVSKEANVDQRFFLNYCTFSYTTPWWEWRDWERLIDWMALNGINTSLAITGQEAIWHKVWSDFGLTDEQIRSYFTGPTHIPFHRMSLLDKWDAPLPQSWMDHEVALQKQIVARERELGIKPVLQAFSGHVPRELKEIYPDAHIQKLGDWVGFDSLYHSYFLDPMDTLFPVIQSAFLKEQTRQYGTDHIYGADPFVEIKPPSWDLDFLDRVSKTIYESMTATDPEAEWLQMAWVFYFDKEWSGERINSYINAVPEGKMTLIDYFCEIEEIWKSTESFFGQPYYWCYLGNFGGNTMLAGNIKDVNQRIDNALQHGGANLAGIGSTLEALDDNPLVYEFVFEKVWGSGEVDLQAWMEDWADRRHGSADENAREAWQILYDRVYSKMPRLAHGTATNGRPAFTGYGHKHWDGVVEMIRSLDENFDISTTELFMAWELLLEAENTSREVYQYDVVNLGRQVLADHFLVLRDCFTANCESGDIEAMRASGAKMIELLNDLDRLLATQKNFMLGHWLADARSFGNDEMEAAYYEKNARNILTTWGEKNSSLIDYANRNWAGLTRDYYSGRWKIFVDEAIASVERGDALDETAFVEKVADFEWNWIEGNQRYMVDPEEDPVAVARELSQKYHGEIVNVKWPNRQ